MSCSLSPSGPVLAIRACAVSRISRRASSGVRRIRLTRPLITLLTFLSVWSKFYRVACRWRYPMSQPASSRLRPIAALRAVRNLMRNREDTQQVFLLIEALRGKTTLRQLARFRRTETGRAVLGENLRLLDRLSDRAG